MRWLRRPVPPEVNENQWHDWFAWFPVPAYHMDATGNYTEREWVWREVIERVWATSLSDYECSRYQYRFKEDVS